MSIMSLRRFGLHEDPFASPHDERFFWWPPHHEDVFNGVFLAILARKRVITVLGESGIGKSGLLRRLVGHVEADGSLVLTVTGSPGVSVEDLMAATGPDFAAARPGVDDGGDLDTLIDRLEERLERAGTGVLAIDDAHLLDDEVLHDLIDLARADTDTGRFLQIVMAGTPDLERKLAEPSLAQAMQTIGLTTRLKPLDEAGVASLIAHRLRRAGSAREDLFEPAAIACITELSGGLPRHIVSLTGESLHTAQRSGAEIVTAALVNVAALGQLVPSSLRTAPHPRAPLSPIAASPIPAPPIPVPPAPSTAAPLSSPLSVVDDAPPPPRPAPPPRRTRPERHTGGSTLTWAAVAVLAAALGAGAGTLLAPGGRGERLITELLGDDMPAMPPIDPTALSGSSRTPIRLAEVAAEPPVPAPPATVLEPVPEAPAATLSPTSAPRLSEPPPGPSPARSESTRTTITANIPPPAPAVLPASPPPSPPPPPAPSPAQRAENTLNLQVQDLKARAQNQISQRRLTTPPGDNAFETFQALSALAPGHPAAAEIRESIKQSYQRMGLQAQQRGQWTEAWRYLQRGLSIVPNDPTLLRLIRELEDRERSERGAAGPTETAPNVTAAAAERSSAIETGATRPEAPAIGFASTNAMIAAFERPDVLRAVIAAGHDFNRILADGTTPLMAAARTGHVEAVRLLLQAGARPEMRGADGASTLVHAATGGNAEVILSLIDAGATVDAGDINGRTALMEAAARGHSAAIRALLDRGAQIDKTNNQGWSALTFATQAGDTEVVRLLLGHGADPRLASRERQPTPAAGTGAPVDLRGGR